MAADIGDEQKAQDDEQQHILASPNINTNTTSDDVLEEIGIDEPKVEIGHAPIKEEDIKFRSENIVRTKGEDLMTNVEGAEERREQEKRAQEKREKETKEQIKKIKEKETKEQIRAARRSRHKAARQAAHTKVKRVAERIYRFRFPIIALAIIAVGIAVADVAIIPAINAQKAAEQQAAKEKAVADNETVMLKILSAAIDKELDETELEDLVKTIDPGATISYFREKGIIYDYDSGSGNTTAQRAEIFNMNMGIYFWSFNQMSRYNQAVTTYSRELPTRY